MLFWLTNPCLLYKIKAEKDKKTKLNKKNFFDIFAYSYKRSVIKSVSENQGSVLDMLMGPYENIEFIF